MPSLPSLSAALLTAVVSSSAQAQDAVPDLKGTWSGVARSVVVGSGYHHPGTETDREPPRIREVRFTYTVRGQDDRLVWGTTSSPAFEEPFAWAISRDNRSVFGADTDGQYRLDDSRAGPDGALLHPRGAEPHEVDRGVLLRDRARPLSRSGRADTGA